MMALAYQTVQLRTEMGTGQPGGRNHYWVRLLFVGEYPTDCIGNFSRESLRDKCLPRCGQTEEYVLVPKSVFTGHRKETVI